VANCAEQAAAAQTAQTDAGGQVITGLLLASNSRSYLKLIALIMEEDYTLRRLRLQQ
jgi:hypothetical protein